MKTDKLSCGTLFIVATPIGNLEDITLRALNTLKNADIIAAEDTRRTVKLLNRYEIKNRLISYHEYTDANKEREILSKLKQGFNIALVSDAGTPIISDPGYKLVKKCIEEDIPIESIPGPCAAVTAVTLSGMDLSRFIFGGFLDSKSGARKKELKRLYRYNVPAVLYESPNRVIKTLKDVAEIWGENTEVCAARELTKVHEEVLRGNVLEILAALNQKNEIKGEFVLILENKNECSQADERELVTMISEQLALGNSKKKISETLSELTGISKKEIYKLAVELDKKC